jgi:hypothetical protein
MLAMLRVFILLTMQTAQQLFESIAMSVVPQRIVIHMSDGSSYVLELNEGSARASGARRSVHYKPNTVAIESDSDSDIDSSSSDERSERSYPHGHYKILPEDEGDDNGGDYTDNDSDAEVDRASDRSVHDGQSSDDDTDNDTDSDSASVSSMSSVSSTSTVASSTPSIPLPGP